MLRTGCCRLRATSQDPRGYISDAIPDENTPEVDSGMARSPGNLVLVVDVAGERGEVTTLRDRCQHRISNIEVRTYYTVGFAG